MRPFKHDHDGEVMGQRDAGAPDLSRPAPAHNTHQTFSRRSRTKTSSRDRPSSNPLSALPDAYAKTVNRVAVAIEYITNRARPHACSRFCKTYPIFLANPKAGYFSTPLHVYMGWLSLASRCSDSCWVMAIILLSRIELALGQPVLCQATSHRLVLTALVVAATAHEDYKTPFKLVSETGGTASRDLAAMELTFLSILSFRVQVSHIDYHQCRRVLKFLEKKRKLNETSVSEGMQGVGEKHSTQDGQKLGNWMKLGHDMDDAQAPPR